MEGRYSLNYFIVILCIFLFLPSFLNSQTKKIDVRKYIMVKKKNSKKFEVKNIAGTRLGIVLGDESPVYISPGKSKSFSFKKQKGYSTISLYYTKKDWETVLNKGYNKIKDLEFLYGFIGAGDDIIYQLRRVGNVNSTTKERERKKQYYKTVKKVQKQEFDRNVKKIVQRLIYYLDLYESSHKNRGYSFIPISTFDIQHGNLF